MNYTDVQLMELALALAAKAFQEDEVPIGALIVDKDRKIVATAYNQVEKCSSQSAHAEMIALQKVGELKSDWRLDGCTLYVTLEPCIMCMGLIRLSRIDRVVYGADSPLFGNQLDNSAVSSVYKKDVIIEKGVCGEKSAELLRQFFKKQRLKKGEYVKTGFESY